MDRIAEMTIQAALQMVQGIAPPARQVVPDTEIVLPHNLGAAALWTLSMFPGITLPLQAHAVRAG